MQIDTACINSLGSLIIFKHIKGHWDQDIWEQLIWVSSPEGGWEHFKGVIKEHKPKGAGETETGFFREQYVSRRTDSLLEKRALWSLLAGTMAAV